mmetsp:Transcript_18095/g.29652  ORF Transcript_18095/g.29652 Transcript_18095/m.29652 type:complete len:238 (+) Transcript_18095:1008-1721(+)
MPPNTSSCTGKLSNFRKPRRRSSSSSNISSKRSASQPLVRKECSKCSVVTVVTVSRLKLGCCLLVKNRSPNGSIAVKVSSTDEVCSTCINVGLYVGLSCSSGSSGDESSILFCGTSGALWTACGVVAAASVAGSVATVVVVVVVVSTVSGRTSVSGPLTIVPGPLMVVTEVPEDELSSLSPVPGFPDFESFIGFPLLPSLSPVLGFPDFESIIGFPLLSPVSFPAEVSVSFAALVCL